MDDLQQMVETYLVTKDNVLLGKILKKLTPLIKGKAFQLSRLAHEEVEDMQQDIYMALLKKIPLYCPEKSKFITFVYAVLRGDPTDTLATKVCKKRGGNGKNMYVTNLSLDMPSEDGKSNLGDRISCKKDFRGDIFNRDIINQVHINPNHKEEIRREMR